MATRGRKPKPPELRLLAGPSRGKPDPLAAKPLPGLPEAPEHLDPVALKEFHRMVDLLERAGVLSQADGAAIALYSTVFSRWIAARADLAARGYSIVSPRGSKSNPSLATIAQCEQIMFRLLSEFGCTPSSRSRVRATPSKKDDLGDFLKR